MKTLFTAALLALGLLAGTGTAPAEARDFWTTLNESAPRSIFDDLRDAAPRTIFDDLRDSAPLAPTFETLRDNAP